MKKTWIYGSLMMMLFTGTLCGCGNAGQTIAFRGIGPDDTNGTQGLYNPGRGFRLETAVDVEAREEDPAEELTPVGEICFGQRLAGTKLFLPYLCHRQGTRGGTLRQDAAVL